MKAITCSQCGALIKRIRERDKFAECEYCHAKIPIQKEKIIVIKDQTPPKPKLRKLSENEKKYLFPSVDDDYVPFFSEDAQQGLIIIGAMVIVFLLFGLPFIYSEYSSKKAKTSKQVQVSSAEKTTSYEIYKTEEKTPTPTPPPDISYRAYVKYNTNIGAEYTEIPTIELEQLPTDMTEAEIKKALFKQKRIKVQISINKDGEVTEAKALNGHEVLKESSVRAAKKSLFSPRRRETKTTLTYIFVLVE
jgi:DNA-directed RNA polymerase subunit RPC12/RpoP